MYDLYYKYLSDHLNIIVVFHGYQCYWSNQQHTGAPYDVHNTIELYFMMMLYIYVGIFCRRRSSF